MGSCYSRQAYKSTTDLSQRPYEKEQTNNANNTRKDSKSVNNSRKHNRKHNEPQLSSSFEELTLSDANHAIMSSSARIPVINKLKPNNKVSDRKANEVSLNKYQKEVQSTRKPNVSSKPKLANTVCDNSSSTSLSSGSSITTSKCSYKSSSCSANSVRTSTAIPRPHSRTPTPPIPVNANVRNRNELQLNDNHNSLTNSSTVNSDHMNGNKTQHMSENQITNIRFKAHVSGLPRPQTAHIVNTSQCHSGGTSVSSKPTAYYFGMDKQWPYKRPNVNVNASKQLFQTRSEQSEGVNTSSIKRPQISQKPFNRFNVTKVVRSSTETLKPINCNNNGEQTNGKSFSDSQTNSESLTTNSGDFSFNPIASLKTDVNNDLPKSVEKIKEIETLNANKNKVKSDNRKAVKETRETHSQKTSPEHNSISSTSGNETDNRDFLIDDEISDQPELVLSASIDKNDISIKNLHNELEGLISKQDSSKSPLSSSSVLSSSSSPNASSNTTTFRRPRPLSFVELPNGSYGLDSPSYRSACQDVNGIKTLLFRLQGLLQNAETLNPFEHSYSQNTFYKQLIIAESDTNNETYRDVDSVQQQNLDLKRQIVLLQQQLQDRDRTIRLLQQQMAKYSNVNNTYVAQNLKAEMVNSASQTDKCENASRIDPRAVSDGSIGMLVSFWISKVPTFA